MSGHYPLVSAIIPVYNSAPYLRACIDSTLVQKYQAIEIIAIDDGSTDNSLEILRGYGDRIRVIKQRNSGQGFARNRGIELAKGRYIAPLDSDDVWDSDKISRQVAVLQEFPEAVATYCDHRTINASGEVISRTAALFGPRSSGRILLDLLRGGNRVESPSFVLIRKDALDATGGFEETAPCYAEDYSLWLRLAAIGPFIYMPETLVSYRVHGKNATLTAGELRQTLGIIRALETVRPFVKDTPNLWIRLAFLERLYDVTLTAAWHARLEKKPLWSLKLLLRAIWMKPLSVRPWVSMGRVLFPLHIFA